MNLLSRFKNVWRDQSFGEVLRGSAVVFASRIAFFLFNFVFSIIVAREYGTGIAGILAEVTTVMNILMMLAVMGTDVSILRFVPEHKAKFSLLSAWKIYQKSVAIVFSLSVMLGAGLFFSSAVIEREIFREENIAYLLGLSAIFIFPKAFYKMSSETLKALKKFKAFAWQNAGIAATKLLLLVVFTYVVFVDEYLPVYVVWASGALGAVVTVVLMGRFFKNKTGPDKQVGEVSLMEIISISMPMFMTSSMFLIIAYTDVIMLGIMTNKHFVGIYDQAFKLAMLANFIRISVNSIAAPKFAELFHSDKIHELENVARKTSKLLSIATLPVAVGLIVFGYHILGAFYGEEFTAGYDALILLVAGQLLSAMVGPVGHLLNMCGREKQCRNILIAGAIINFALNLVLIPIWGITGAAVANMVAVIFNNLCFLFYVKKSFGIFVMYVPFLPKK